MAIRVLRGHYSRRSAHLSFNHPYGVRTRCIRREWIERASSGAHRGFYRFVAQTTAPEFNVQYTAHIEQDGLDAANDWARVMIASTKNVTWNKPHPSTYAAFVLLVASQIQEPTHERISFLSLPHTATSDELTTFAEQTRDQLTNEERDRLNRIAAITKSSVPK